MTTQELIDHTKRLITFPSTADNPEALHEAYEYVVGLVNACPGVTVERFERNGKPSFVAYRGSVRPVEFDILLNAHLDVVPGRAEQFKPVEKAGRLYGRGALDMKGTAVVLTDVFCEMVGQVSYNLGLQIVTDEEIGGHDGVRLQIDEGVRAKFVVMGEYANRRHTIYNAARGLCWAEIAFKGKEAHGGHLWHGSNAVLKASDFAAAVLEHYPTPDRETWTTTASIASLSTPNTTFNKVPDQAVLKIDFRFIQEDPVFRDRASLEAFVYGIDPEAKILKLATFEPAVSADELNPYVQGLTAALRRVSRSKPQFLGRPAGSDGRHYALVDCDIVEFGLYGQHPHSDHEYVELSSFAEYQAVMREFLRQPVPVRLKAQGRQSHKALHHRLLEELVAMPTVTGDFVANNKALAFIGDFLRSRGMHIEQFERNGYRSLVATTRPHNTRPVVMLNAHTDVVPADAKLFRLTSQDDRLMGRGVMDMKMAIAGYLELVDSLQGELHDYDFGIMITSDEEVGGKHGVEMLVKEFGYRPGVVVTPDAGENWQLETFSKGVQWIRLEASGKSGHASRPWEGESAINRLFGALKDIEVLLPPSPLPEETLLSIGTIEGGTTANQIPIQASAMLDIRYGSAEDYKRIPQRIKSICRQHGVKTTIMVSDPPSYNDPANPYIKPFVDLVAQVTGKHQGTSMSYGVTDARFFSAAGVPCVVIAPPAGGRHRHDEWLSKSGFDQFCVILERYVRQIAGAAPSVQLSKEEDIARLAKRLNRNGKPAYIWYATYCSGLSREDFMYSIAGGTPPDARHPEIGCTDKTPPLKDMFITLPYELYFAGKSKLWSGGLATLELEPSPDARTISRAYLITIEQFEELAAHLNFQTGSVRLPIARAIKDGHTAISGIGGDRIYGELLYCGIQDDIPILTITASRQDLPRHHPQPEYTRFLCKGLSENKALTSSAVVDYLNGVPGIAERYKRPELAKFVKEAAQMNSRRR